MTTRWRIGVCSWSLEPPDALALAERVAATGATAVQLALDPIRLGMMELGETRRHLRAAGLTVVSGMMAMEGEDYATLERIRVTGGIVPDATWPANLRAAGELARIAEELGIPLVSFHAGFLPDDAAAPSWPVLVDRLSQLAAVYGERRVQVALETGQETVDALNRLLAALERHDVGVNFDPGNLILYGRGDPVAALRALSPRVAQVHVKDALPSLTPEAWGTEVPVGEGAVDWAAFLDALRGCPAVSTLVIEREAGRRRVEDVIQARRFLEAALG